MKVLCIDDSGCSLINEGEIYTADKGTAVFNPENYYIVEVDNFYCQDRFVPLSDIDETEFIREKELVCV